MKLYAIVEKGTLNFRFNSPSLATLDRRLESARVNWAKKLTNDTDTSMAAFMEGVEKVVVVVTALNKEFPDGCK